MTVRDRLREIGVRLVELANYLKMSRPTMYKYLELYENQEYTKIDKVTYDLFSFIEGTENLTKPGLMNYLINKIVPVEQVVGDNTVAKISESIRKLSQSNNLTDKKRYEMIHTLLYGSFDEVQSLLEKYELKK